MLSKAFILAVILCESGGNPIARSPSDAYGLMQLTEIGFKEVQQQYGITEEINIFNPQENIKYGTLLLEFYYHQSGGSLARTLVLYNSGYAGLLRYRTGGPGALPEQTRLYVPKVLALMRNLDPMFQRQLPERRERGYLETAIDDVFYDLYGLGESGEQVLFGSGLLAN